jgi:hypothetical protein
LPCGGDICNFTALLRNPLSGSPKLEQGRPSRHTEFTVPLRPSTRPQTRIMFLEWSSATSQNSLCADLSSLLQPATWTASWRAFTFISSEIIAVQTTTAVIAGKLHSVSYAGYLFPPAQVIHIQRSSLAHRPHSMRGKHHNNLLSYRRLLQDDDQDLRSPPQDNKPPTSPSALRIHGTRQRAPPMQRASITFGNPSRTRKIQSPRQLSHVQ